MVDEQLLQSFLLEATDILSGLDERVLYVEQEPDDAAGINDLFRAVHTLKGSAGSMGLAAFVDVAHRVESTLVRMRERQIVPSSELTSALLECVDVLRRMVARLREGDHDSSESPEEIHALDALASVDFEQPPRMPRGGPRLFRIEVAFDQALSALDPEAGACIAELVGMGEARELAVDLASLPSLADLDTDKCYASWRILLETTARSSDLGNVFILSALDNRITITEQTSAEPSGRGAVAAPTAEAAPRAPEAPAGKSEKHGGQVRVETEKLDALLCEVGELALAVAHATEVLGEERASAERREGAIELLERCNREIQQRSLALRMTPLRATFVRFKRVVRDLSVQLGKEIDLVIQGADTELDKELVECVVDPLKHLVRNAVDHGLEPPERRAAAGKPPRGTLHLRARHSAGSVIIEVADDGAGLNSDAIRRKAVERGLLAPDARPSPSELADLIFAPGFSTAAAVTEVSGRGVGLDVVRSNVERFGGHVEVLSQPGKGTTFRLTLPLSLAVVDALQVRVGGERFSIPLSVIAEQLRPERQQLKTINGQVDVLCLRNQTLPLVRLHQLFEIPRAVTDPTRGVVIVIEHEQRYAIGVDGIDAPQQILIKSLSENYRPVPGLAGVTLLGDGDLSLVLDVASLHQLAFGRAAAAAVNVGSVS
jgi:two-component system, chemotaxis family, sensor kinase CheA